MKFKFSFISLFVFTLFFGFLSTKAAFADTFALSGSVQTASGSAISGVTVSVNDSNNDSATTDSSGNYSFSIPSGTYNVQVTPPSGSGFSSAIALSQNISANTTLNFILVPSGSVRISGILYDALGNPVSGSTVVLQLPDGTQLAQSSTNSTGNYSFKVSSGTYHLFVFNGNTFGNYPWRYNLYDFPDTSYSQSTIQNITLPVKQVNVHVQDGAGNAVSNVTLSTGTNLVAESNLSIGNGVTIDGSDGYTATNLKTDASGNATMWLFPGSNPYTIIATPPGGHGLATTTFENNIINGNTSLTLTLQPSITISGVLSDPLGNPISGATVVLRLPDDTQIAQSVTSSTGNYSFTTSAGTYYLLVFNGNTLGNYPWHYQIQFPNTSYNQTTSQNITIPAKQVSVHVQDGAGTAIGNAVLSTGTDLISEDNLIIGGISVSGADGYTATNLRTDASGNAKMWLFPGNNPYTIIVTPPGGQGLTQTIFDNNIT